MAWYKVHMCGPGHGIKDLKREAGVVHGGGQECNAALTDFRGFHRLVPEGVR